MATLTPVQTQWLKKVIENPECFKEVPPEIQTEIFLQSHTENRFKTYRLSRYAIRLNKTNRWFSPYHVLESYEDYLLMPECERVI